MIGGRRVVRAVTANVLDAMFLVGSYLARNREPAIKGEVSDRHEEYFLFLFVIKSHVAQDAALVAFINDFGYLAIAGELGGGRLPAQIGHQSRGHERQPAR